MHGHPLTESIDFSNIIPDLEARLLRIETIKGNILDKNNLNEEVSKKQYLLEIRLLVRRLQYLGIQIPGEDNEKVRKRLRRLIVMRHATHERVFRALFVKGQVYTYHETGRSLADLTKIIEITAQYVLKNLISNQESLPILRKRERK